jgi:hypothetical protein
MSDNPTPAAPRAAPKRVRQRGWLHRFLYQDEHRADDHAHATQPWWKVLWLTGVDYFSTLGYQPGIAFLAAGILSPVATALLIVVTLAGALPVYALVARYSYIGQGSIAMLERLVSGWTGKVIVLVLLGFAATDFVITMTLSAADAAQHIVENPWYVDLVKAPLANAAGTSAAPAHPITAKILLTTGMLALLAIIFLRGFREAIGVAMLVGVPYMFLTAVIGVRGLIELAQHPEFLERWTSALALKGDTTALLGLSAIIFPKLALGMSGFETGASVMPLIAGGDPAGASPPLGRIRATRKMLLTAALLMSAMLILCSIVTTLIIPADAFQPGGKANGRAMAYLAHGLLGPIFGSVYDVSTILILWFAGASAMAGMLNLIPRYLPRFGMAPKWTAHQRPLILVLFVISVLVTLVFKADVDAQGGAYATGVLALMLSAAAAVALVLWREARAARRFPLGSLYFWLVSAVFAFTLGDNVHERPDGVIIAAVFIVAVLTVSAISRFRRAMELRVERTTFVDEASERLWQGIKGKKVHLVPIAFYDPVHLSNKEWRIRNYYNVGEGAVAFLQVLLIDDRSEFSTTLKIKAEPLEEGDGYLVTVSGAVAVANTIAWVSEELDPISIFLTLTRKNAMTQSLKHLIWGEGEIGILVYNILVRYWESTPEEDVRPRIFLLSD